MGNTINRGDAGLGRTLEGYTIYDIFENYNSNYESQLDEKSEESVELEEPVKKVETKQGQLTLL